MDDVRGRVEEAVPRMEVEFIQLLSDLINDLAGSPDPIEIKLFGDELETLREYAERVSPKLEEIEGLVDLYDGVPDPSPELVMRVNEPAAARLGLTPKPWRARWAPRSWGRAGERCGATSGPSRSACGRRTRCATTRLVWARSRSSAPTAALRPPLSARRDVHGQRVGRRAHAREPAPDDRDHRGSGGALARRSRGRRGVGPRRESSARGRPDGGRGSGGGAALGVSQRLLLALALAALSVVAVMLVQFESFVEPLAILLAAPLSFMGAWLCS
jgi:hypothetical protein